MNKMKKRFQQVLAMLVLSMISIGSFAAEAPGFTAQTSMSVILDNPAATAVMAKYIPDVMSDPQIQGARAISLGELASYIPDQLTAEVIGKILVELNAL